jgi:hypothetical protein
MNPSREYSQMKSYAKSHHILFTLTFEQWWDIWEKSGCYEARGGSTGYVMTRLSRNDGFVPGNIDIVPRSELFRQTMDDHYGWERNYL